MFALDVRRTTGCLAMGVVVFLVCYGAATWFGHSAAVATVWPANALALAYTLRYGRSRWSMAACLASAGFAMALANALVGRPLITTLGFPVANVIEIALAAWFMRDVAVPMARTSDLRQFFLGAVLAGPLASAVIASIVMAAAFGVDGAQLVRQGAGWLVSDMTGMAIVAPVALSLGLIKRGGWGRALTAPAVIGLISFALCFQKIVPLTFVAFPMVAAAVMRDRDRGAALGVGAVATAILVAAALGFGPVVNLDRIGLDAVRAVQVFLGALVLTVYPIAALVRRLDVYAAEAERGRAVAVADSAAKSRVMSQVGEELRSPLTGVVTVAEMLKSGRLGDLNDRQRDLLVRIAESGAEIEALSHEMMTMADRGERVARGAPLAGIVERAGSAARFRAHRRRVTIELSPGDPAWQVAIEADRLNRLVADALASAIDAAPADSVVRVEAALDGDAHVILAVEDAAASTVADRAARIAMTRLVTPETDGWSYDRAELRRSGGDLKFGRSDLGGGRLTLRLPRAPGASDSRAA